MVTSDGFRKYGEENTTSGSDADDDGDISNEDDRDDEDNSNKGDKYDSTEDDKENFNKQTSMARGA